MMGSASPVVVGRDPFARYDVIRAKAASGPCSWCGAPAKFVYGVWWDAGRKSWDGKPFCSKGCRDAYYG